MAAPLRSGVFSKTFQILTNTATRKPCFTTGTRPFSNSQTLYDVCTDYKAEPIPAGLLDEDFRVLIIPGHTHTPKKKERDRIPPPEHPPPRYLKMKPDQDWTNVWPTATSFKWSAVPLPVRMGVTRGVHEDEGLPRGTYANPELMKIPNFLHLTPAHIKKQCAAIKKFCTPWPKGLETSEECDKHFPIKIITRDYVKDDMSVRDNRARFITLKIKLGSLKLDYHAKDKMKRLVGDKYNEKRDLLTLDVDRCPMKKQNIDYAEYLLTALFFESWKVEPWEAEKDIVDMEQYYWDIMPSKKSVVETIKMQKSCVKEKGVTVEPEHLSKVTDVEELNEEDIVDIETVKKYKEVVSTIHNEGEDLRTIEEYKKVAVELLLGKKVNAAQ